MCFKINNILDLMFKKKIHSVSDLRSKFKIVRDLIFPHDIVNQNADISHYHV